MDGQRIIIHILENCRTSQGRVGRESLWVLKWTRKETDNVYSHEGLMKSSKTIYERDKDEEWIIQREGSDIWIVYNKKNKEREWKEGKKEKKKKKQERRLITLRKNNKHM